MVFITSKLGYWTGHLQYHLCLPYPFLTIESIHDCQTNLPERNLCSHCYTSQHFLLTHPLLLISSSLTFLLLLSYSLSKLFTKEKLNTTNVRLMIVSAYLFYVCLHCFYFMEFPSSPSSFVQILSGSVQRPHMLWIILCSSLLLLVRTNLIFSELLFFALVWHLPTSIYYSYLCINLIFSSKEKIKSHIYFYPQRLEECLINVSTNKFIHPQILKCSHKTGQLWASMKMTFIHSVDF